ncbi:MAG: GNAT family N-acetyltransferase [Rhodospirillaceae bacterium]|jgi:ribosomal protein S18 acetylase RimI-like enzyme|nr:GNAT family N-acetyltransferase [Rhodospirillaceae bacterium]
MITFRPATVEDSPAIAELYQMAAGGVADYVWSMLAEPGETLLDVGARRFAREGEDFSYQHCTMAEQDGAVLGMVHAYPMFEIMDVDDDMDPVLRPYCDLESAPGLYIAGIACYPVARGKGVGTQLLELVRQRARRDNLPELSLIAFEQNTGSVRLYEREKFDIVRRRAIVAHELIQYTGDALLMVASL